MNDIDFELIKKYNEEIEKLLVERPEYREFQKKITETIRKGGNQHNRVNIAFSLMIDKLHELDKKLKELIERSTV